MEAISILWNELLIRPLTNALVVLYVILFNNFGLSIIGFTVFMRIATMRLTLKQIKSMRAMAAAQPQLQALKTRYKNDRQKMSQETFRIYKENGINPIGCLGPMVLQMPIMIGLVIVIRKILPSNPEDLISLSDRLYSWLGIAHSAVPIHSGFMGFGLDQTPTEIGGFLFILLPVLVGASMWVQQKMMTIPSQDPKQQQQQQMMLWMMPLVFGFFTINFSSGLALYFFVSNVMGVAIQYFTTGWGGLRPALLDLPGVPAVDTASGDDEAAAISEPAEELNDDGQRRSQREDSGRSNRAGSKAARRKSRRGRNRGSQSR